MAEDDPADCSKARKDMDDFLDSKVEKWCDDRAKSKLRALGSSSNACKHLSKAHAKHIEEVFDKELFLVLDVKCIVDMAGKKKDVFDYIARDFHEEKVKIRAFLGREDGHFCKNMASFKDTKVYRSLRTNCPNIKLSKELEAAKKENEELKAKVNKADEKKTKESSNEAPSDPASAFLFLASTALAIIFFPL